MLQKNEAPRNSCQFKFIVQGTQQSIIANIVPKCRGIAKRFQKYILLEKKQMKHT
jgi:hypothetical protein